MTETQKAISRFWRENAIVNVSVAVSAQFRLFPFSASGLHHLASLPSLGLLMTFCLFISQFHFGAIPATGSSIFTEWALSSGEVVLRSCWSNFLGSGEQESGASTECSTPRWLTIFRADTQYLIGSLSTCPPSILETPTAVRPLSAPDRGTFPAEVLHRQYLWAFIGFRWSPELYVPWKSDFRSLWVTRHLHWDATGIKIGNNPHGKISYAQLSNVCMLWDKLRFLDNWQRI